MNITDFALLIRAHGLESADPLASADTAARTGGFVHRTGAEDRAAMAEHAHDIVGGQMARRPLTSRAVNHFDRNPSLNPLSREESRDALKPATDKAGNAVTQYVPRPEFIRAAKPTKPVLKIGTGKAR